MMGWPGPEDYPGEEVAPRPPLSYRLFGWWIRWQACKMAAQTVGSPTLVPTNVLLWSFTVFFETYMWSGAAATRADFGPKEPVDLRVMQVKPGMKVIS